MVTIPRGNISMALLFSIYDIHGHYTTNIAESLTKPLKSEAGPGSWEKGR